jgi:hypothetical protein
MLSIDVGPLADAFGRLPLHDGENGGDAPPGHPFFGAGFLFVGTLLVVETLAGDIWRRSNLRAMLWPGALLTPGLGMLAVTYVQPTEKSLHLTLALLLLVGAVFEGRYRLGQISRSAADTFAVPALIVGGFVIGPMHANGTLLYSSAANTHMLVGVAGWALAGIKFVRVQHGPTVALDAGFATGVMALGVSLLLVEQFHGAH